MGPFAIRVGNRGKLVAVSAGIKDHLEPSLPLYRGDGLVARAPIAHIGSGSIAALGGERRALRSGGGRIDFDVTFASGSRFACPACGAEGQAVHDTRERAWRHLHFFQHQAFIHARLPRVRCEQCGKTTDRLDSNPHSTMPPLASCQTARGFLPRGDNISQGLKFLVG